MTVSAHTVAAELRRRLPGASTTQVHKLLYYTQGHHLAALGRPLFAETIVAWDLGPVVGALWQREKHGGVVATDEALDEAALNTIGFVVSRYGGLTPRDLITLTHHEAPWQQADERRRAGGSVPITHDSLREFFTSAEEFDDEPALDDSVIAELVAGAEERREEPASVDSLDEIERRIRALTR